MLISLNKKNKTYMFCFALIFIAIWLILFKKCKYGFADVDECYYLALLNRIYQGDPIFSGDFGLASLSSYLLLPIYTLYMKLFNSTDYLIINFRYIFTFIWGIASLIIFERIRRINLLSAFFSSILFMIYVPFGIMQLSYNSMGILFLTLSCVFYITNGNKIDFILSGTFYSFSVLCCPALVVIVLIYFIFSIVNHKIKEEFIYFLFGIIVQFIIFIIYLFSKTDIQKIISSIPLILDDPSHYHSISVGSIYYFLYIWSNSLIFNSKILLVILALLFGICLLNRKNNNLLFLPIVVIFILIIYVYCSTKYINYIMFPLSLLAPFCRIYDSNSSKLFNYLWLPGIVYSLCIHYCSNQGEYAIYSALTISSIASIIMLFNIYSLNKKNICYLIIILVLLISNISFEIYLRWNTIFWSSSPSEQIYLITDDVENGIFVTEDKYDYYYQIKSAFDKLEFKDESVLYLSNNPIYYLFGNAKMRNSSYSTWFGNNYLRQKDYLLINKDKVPDNIFYPIYDYGKYDDLLDYLINEYEYTEYDINGIGKLFYIKN